MGFVNIGGILVPESSRPAERYACRLPGCGFRCASPEHLAKHVNLHMQRDEQDVRELSLEERMPEFYASDKEREAYWRSERGKAEWRRKMGPDSV